MPGPTCAWRKARTVLDTFQVRFERRWGHLTHPRVRALAWLGPEKAEAALTTLKRKMPPGVFGELVAAAPQLPTWLAQSVGKAAYG